MLTRSSIGALALVALGLMAAPAAAQQPAPAPPMGRPGAVAGDEDNRHPASRDGERLLQLQTSQTGHPNVQDQTAEVLMMRTRQELASRREDFDSIAGGGDQARHTLPHGRVIVHDTHQGPRRSAHGR